MRKNKHWLEVDQEAVEDHGGKVGLTVSDFIGCTPLQGTYPITTFQR